MIERKLYLKRCKVVRKEFLKLLIQASKGDRVTDEDLDKVLRILLRRVALKDPQAVDLINLKEANEQLKYLLKNSGISRKSFMRRLSHLRTNLSKFDELDMIPIARDIRPLIEQFLNS